MKIAIIVVSCLVAALVVGFFVWRAVRRHKQMKKTELETGVKHERRTFKQWLKDHKPSKRRLIQVYAALLYNANIKGYIKGGIYTGATTKYLCVPGLNCYSCPAAVGACPLGAFQNALAESGTRAPYYVIGILALFGLIFARTICGFLCPVGLGQELLYKIRSPKLKKSRVTRILSYFKYVLLVLLVVIVPLLYALRNVPLPAFCKYICPAGTIGGAIGLLLHPDNGGMFAMLGGQFLWKFALLVAFIVASVFIFRFFCRFFCPLGAIYGFFNRIALIGVKVNKNDCTDCGKCVSVCKMDVKRVGDHECINCGECISVCPTKAISWKGSKLLLHKQAVEEAPAKPLSVANGTVAAAELFPAPQGAEGGSAACVAPAPLCETPTEEMNTVVRPRPKRTKAFWLELSAWILAIAVLIGALVYYNFIDTSYEPKETVGYKVGDVAPDFTVNLYDSEENFTLYEHRGKITVIHFWDVENQMSADELSYFNELATSRTDLNVLAIHGNVTSDASAFIQTNWSESSLLFAQDGKGKDYGATLELFGGETMPMTVMIDGKGVILYNSTDIFESYSSLKNLLDELIPIGFEVGKTAPDFTVSLYSSEESFTLYDNRGKMTVIYFWEIGNAKSVEELAYLNRLAKDRSDVKVLAIHGNSDSDVNAFLQENWAEHALTFAQDNLDGNVGLTFELLGGKDAMPMTVILNEEGKVIYNSTDTFESYEDVTKLMRKLTIGYEVGMTAPDFTVELYGSDGNFTLSENRGKLTVVNFWATWCTPCVQEIPYFDMLAKDRPDISVIAIHGSSTRDVNEFIERKGWTDYALTFAQDNIQDNICLTFQMLGGKSAWPMTVIVDEEGVVLYNSTVSFHNYEELKTLIDSLTEAQE